MVQPKQPITIKLLVNGLFQDIYASDLQRDIRKHFRIESVANCFDYPVDAMNDLKIMFLASEDTANEVLEFINNSYELPRNAEIV